jgi:hypothetical protein
MHLVFFLQHLSDNCVKLFYGRMAGISSIGQHGDRASGTAGKATKEKIRGCHLTYIFLVLQGVRTSQRYGEIMTKIIVLL